MIRCLVGLGFLSVVGLAQEDARALFTAQCGVCHGDGHGTERGPNLTNNRKVRGWDNDQLRAAIRNGVPASGMPAFESLSAADLERLTVLVRSFNATAADAGVAGDKAAGERFFFGKGGCTGCHMVLGQGKAAGPDLSYIGREATRDHIEESVLKPSARIRAGYRTFNVTLKSGGAPIRGFARNRSRYSLQLQDLNGRFHLLKQDEIAEARGEAQSMMPATQCSADECRDLIAYLSSLAGGRASAFPMTAGAPKLGDWPSYHGDIGGNRHSPLAQITTANVKGLRLEWVFPINHNQLEVTPVVIDGVMYVTGPNQVFALDGRSGRTIWHYQRPRSRETRGDPSRGTNRGVAVQGDRVFLVTDNAHLIALHRVTGQLLWESAMAADLAGKSYAANYGNTSAPIVVGDTVVAGISGGDLGMRGFLDAYRADTGERIWRFWTVPEPGEPLANSSWQGTALARYGGGGGTWMTGTYDPETDTVFWGVGNPFPAMSGDERKGDNLYTASVVAVEAKTGRLKWHYQFTPHDLFDWDGGQTPLLINRNWRGRDRKLLLQANRNGFFYVLDRTNGELLLGEKFVDKLTWATGIGKDGRPILVPGQEPTRDGNKVCPNVLGATNWHSVAFSQVTGLFYLMAREDCGIYVKPPNWNPRPITLEPGHAALRALDIETGKRVWEVPQIGRADSWGGVLSTAGGVVFFGEDSGAFGAVDAKTGRDLWQIQVNSSAELGDGHSWRASPMTYSAGGKQYVTVANGPNILTFGLP
jgi:PQQ-dependent dehydrogenase (methanol/ethanol family)